jgi:hypothetical protein
LKIIGKQSNPPYGGLLCLIGKEKQRVMMDRNCCCVGTGKNRKMKGKKNRASEYVAPKLLIILVVL